MTPMTRADRRDAEQCSCTGRVSVGYRGATDEDKRVLPALLKRADKRARRLAAWARAACAAWEPKIDPAWDAVNASTVRTYEPDGIICISRTEDPALLLVAENATRAVECLPSPPYLWGNDDVCAWHGAAHAASYLEKVDEMLILARKAAWFASGGLRRVPAILAPLSPSGARGGSRVLAAQGALFSAMA